MIQIIGNSVWAKEAVIELPSSKSISNRLLILQAFEEGIQVDQYSEANDTKILQKLLEKIKANTSEELSLDVEDAGTVFRFLLGFLALQEGIFMIRGSKRMMERPIKPLVEALLKLGADIEYMGQIGFAPLKIRGKKMKGGKIELDASVSSQFVSSLLLIGWKFENGLTLELKNKVVSNAYIQMTVGLLQKAQMEVQQYMNTITIPPHQKLQKFHLDVEKDWSSASYFYAVMLGMKTGKIHFKGLRENSLQGDKIMASMALYFGIKTIFQEEGATIFYEPMEHKDILYFDCINCPDLAQTMMVMCCIAGRNAEFKGLDTLPNKETDRIFALKTELFQFGYVLHENKGIYFLEKEEEIDKYRISVTTYGDHRMAMAFSAMATKYIIEMEDANIVQKSFPDFWNQLAILGFKIKHNI